MLKINVLLSGRAEVSGRKPTITKATHGLGVAASLCCGYMISHASVTIPKASKPCVRSLLSRYTYGDPGHTRAVRTVTATGHKIPNLLGENIFRGPHILPSPRRFIGEHNTGRG